MSRSCSTANRVADWCSDAAPRSRRVIREVTGWRSWSATRCVAGVYRRAVRRLWARVSWSGAWNAEGVPDQLRLADVLGGLSVVSDMGYGLPMETAMRACLVGTALARTMDLPEAEVRDVFFVSLLLHMGCIGFSHETAVLFGDDLAVNRAAIRTNLTDVRQVFTVLIPGMTREMQSRRSAEERRDDGRQRPQRSGWRTTWRAARWPGLLPAASACPKPVSAGLYDVHEWWNGRGARGLRAADDRRTRPLGAGRDRGRRPRRLQRQRRGRPRDSAAGPARRWIPGSWMPSPRDAPSLLQEVAFVDPRARVLEVEPAPVAEIPEPDMARIAAAFGDLVDLKTPFTHGHSGAVADLAVVAAERVRLDPLAVGQLRVAALLHDVGRAGVSNAVWEKPGPLTTAEWEQARLHAYLSERVLATSAALAPMAPIAGMHHERLDGSGYHRGCRAPELPTAARILAAADAFQAMIEPRPHRAALEPDQAAAELGREAHAGRLDPDAVAAVLESAGRPPARRRNELRPGGLSDREVEVLRLMAAGCTNPDIGRTLGISPAHRRAPRSAHLHQDRRVDPRRRHALRPRTQLARR